MKNILVYTADSGRFYILKNLEIILNYHKFFSPVNIKEKNVVETPNDNHNPALKWFTLIWLLNPWVASLRFNYFSLFHSSIKVGKKSEQSNWKKNQRIKFFKGTV